MNEKFKDLVNAIKEGNYERVEAALSPRQATLNN